MLMGNNVSTEAPTPLIVQGPSEEDITTIATIPTSESDVQLMTLLALFQTDYCVSSVTLR